MNYRSPIRGTMYFGRGSFNVIVSALTHPLRPIEIDRKTGKLIARYNSDDEMRRARIQRWVNYLTPLITGAYDETVGDSSVRERFETRLRERLLETELEGLI